jgi:phage terminase small subunit
MAPGKLSAAEAYRQAGYSQNRPKQAASNAKQLTTKNHIKARIAFLGQEYAKKHEVTRDTLRKELDVAVERCLANGEHSTYVRALEAKMRLYGMDKQVVLNEDHSQLTAEEEAYYQEFAAWRLEKDRQANIRKIG